MTCQLVARQGVGACSHGHHIQRDTRFYTVVWHHAFVCVNVTGNSLYRKGYILLVPRSQTLHLLLEQCSATPLITTSCWQLNGGTINYLSIGNTSQMSLRYNEFVLPGTVFYCLNKTSTKLCNMHKTEGKSLPSLVRPTTPYAVRSCSRSYVQHDAQQAAHLSASALQRLMAVNIEWYIEREYIGAFATLKHTPHIFEMHQKLVLASYPTRYEVLYSCMAPCICIRKCHRKLLVPQGVHTLGAEVSNFAFAR